LNPDGFLDLVSRLTGTPTSHTASDLVLLERILHDDEAELDYSQFNELLLLVNKNRVGKPFFHKFFGGKCRIKKLADHVAGFQAAAMLRYGNFVFAYRSLSRIDDQDEFDAELGVLCTDHTDVFIGRSGRLLEIESIPRADTSLVGYLSATQIVADLERCNVLKLACEQIGASAEWAMLMNSLQELTKPDARQSVVGIVGNYRKLFPSHTPKNFEDYLASVFEEIKGRHDRMLEVQAIAIQNQDVYLTWDYMDVYFATSMRKPWEFTDLYDFVNGLMNTAELKTMNVSYFDPTQSYTKERVDKGLVESLMLKRARCTVYSVQDTDTLGKDSELAATLAQGKPVIAYVPTISVSDRAEALTKAAPAAILDRLRFVLHADEKFLSELSSAEVQFVEEFRALNEFTRTTLFRSVQNIELDDRFKSRNLSELRQLTTIIAGAEKRIYDSRANTLKNFHPLGIQVHLDTGVANGVLIVRSIPECATLLRRILMNSMEFDVEDGVSYWALRERTSGSIFRVVTKNAKVNNCFWNFYLRG
jgi:hypothetical protein